MGVDEAILETYARAGASLPPTLRLYGWRPAALSLGRRQCAAESHDARYLREQGIDLLRRPSGGRAVLHDRERTYAVAGRLHREPFTGGVVQTYAQVAAALAAALARLGVAATAAAVDGAQRHAAGHACFASLSAHELGVHGRKLVGSAQVRRRGAFLQHGSIPLEGRHRRLERALGAAARMGGATDLACELGYAPAPDLLDRALIEAFESCFGARLERGELSDAEAQRAEQLRCWKYTSASWTLSGELGLRERRWGPALG
jgi:lipoate-protein ligase A